MNIDKIIEVIIGDNNQDRTEGFLRFISEKLWCLYDEYIMDKIKMAENYIKWNLDLPNAKENQTYSNTVTIPTIPGDKLPGMELVLVSAEGLDETNHGLSISISSDKKSFTITGTPCLDSFREGGATAQSTFDITLKCRIVGKEIPEDKGYFQETIPFVINQDPRKLWKNMPVDWDNMPTPKYKNEDIQTSYVKVESLSDGTPQKDIVAASKRGRSHAQEGKPRDDYYTLRHLDNGWYIMAVADGAGSAKYSRKGSEIACKESVDHCILQLLDCKDFEEAIALYNNRQEDFDNVARKNVGDHIYNIVGKAAFKAHKAINSEATTQSIPSKQYATTLLLTICKKFDFGWFIASFWVGDGAICLYNKGIHTAKILGIPDGGEYAGQTRFLTMPEIFQDATALYQRLRFEIVEDFTALFLMTDGVSDPKFETDNNLINPNKWDELWNDLQENGVELTDDNENAKDQLLDWLDFWSPGNHDDRTIAILYEGDAKVGNVVKEEDKNIEQDKCTELDSENKICMDKTDSVSENPQAKLNNENSSEEIII